jgi:transcriptional regulator with XRE-family HTH domain
MEKSIYTRDYAAMRAVLRDIRRAANVTQIELAEKLGTTQSFVTKCERGDRRLDLVQVRTICHALGTTLPEFVRQWEERLPASRRKGSR